MAEQGQRDSRAWAGGWGSGQGDFSSNMGLRMTQTFSKAELRFSSEQSVSQGGNFLLCFATGQDSRKVALEMVCPRMHPLSQVLQQE